MDTEPKLTPWFVNGEAPARPGVYLVDHAKAGQRFSQFAYWGGPRGGWGAAAPTPSQAFNRKRLGLDPNYFHQTGSWRGLSEKPA